MRRNVGAGGAVKGVAGAVARQVLAVAYATSTKVREYCLNRVGAIFEARIADVACRDSALPPPFGFPNYNTPLDSALQDSHSHSQPVPSSLPSVLSRCLTSSLALFLFCFFDFCLSIPLLTT